MCDTAGRGIQLKRIDEYIAELLLLLLVLLLFYIYNETKLSAYLTFFFPESW